MPPPRRRSGSAVFWIAAAVVVVVFNSVGLGGSGVRAQTNTLESVSTYRQCNVRDFSPDEQGQFRCDGAQGYTVFVVNMKPGTGGGDVYQTTMGSTQFERAPSDYRLNPGADLPQDRARGVATTNIVVTMSDVFVRYQTRLLPTASPSSYDIMHKSGNLDALLIGTAVAGLLAIPAGGAPLAALALGISYSIGIGRSFPACNGAKTASLCRGGGQPIANASCYSNPGLGLAPARCDPLTSPSTCILATPAEMQSQCVALSCGSCPVLGGGPDRFACNSEIFWWVKPLWRIYEVLPLPVVEYTVTVNITDTTTGASELIVLGSATDSTTRAVACANCSNTSPAPPSSGGSGFSSFTLVGFSQNGAVRAEILSQSRFGMLPYQDGIIVAADDAGGQWGAGYEEGPVNPRAVPAGKTAGEHCSGAAFDCDVQLTAVGGGKCWPRTRPTDSFCAPPRNWFWGRNFEQQMRFGNCYNCFGMRPDYWLTDAGRDFACVNDQHSGVAGFDYWSSPSRMARPPAYFVNENLRFHRDAQQLGNVTGAARAQTPFFMPQPSCAGPGCPNVWMHREQLFVTPPRNIGARVRLGVRVAGNFSRLVRVLGRGELRLVNNGTNDCVLTLGRQGSLFIDACNTGAQRADYSVALACESSAYDTQVSTQSATIDPGNCFRADFQIGLSGAAISETPRPCTATLLDAENNVLSNATATCTEQDIAVSGPSGGVAEPPSALKNCVKIGSVCVPSWLVVLFTVLVVAFVVFGALLVTCVALRSFSKARGGRSSAPGGMGKIM